MMPDSASMEKSREPLSVYLAVEKIVDIDGS